MIDWLPELRIDPDAAQIVPWQLQHNLEGAFEHRRLQAGLALKSQSLYLIIAYIDNS